MSSRAAIELPTAAAGLGRAHVGMLAANFGSRRLLPLRSGELVQCNELICTLALPESLVRYELGPSAQSLPNMAPS